MVENQRFGGLLAHVILALGVFILAFPVYIAFVGSTQDAATIANGQLGLLPGSHGFENYWRALTQGGGAARTPASLMLLNSLASALIIAIGKISISIFSAFSIVYFRFPLRRFFFWVIFLTLMLPVEVRIYPTYKIVADLHMVNTYAGMTIPLIASATATLLFRQFFLTVPDELTDAAKIDGAGPMQFFRDILLPLSRVNIAALFIIFFIYGWNQYLWPLLIASSDTMQTIVVGIKAIASTHDSLTEWQIAMAIAMLAMGPPVAVVLGMQRLFVKGLIETEK